MGDRLLSLSTIVDRDTISVASKKHPDGKEYELRDTADLGPLEHAKIMQLDGERRALMAKPRPTKSDDARAQQIVDDLVRTVVLGLEPAVLRGMTPEQRQMIFLAWVAKMAAGAAEGNAPDRAARRTGVRSSRASKRSTAATPKRGGTRRRG